jgi:hypothetical protein
MQPIKRSIPDLHRIADDRFVDPGRIRGEEGYDEGVASVAVSLNKEIKVDQSDTKI